MSLRLRILLAFVLVLVSGSGVGLALAGLEARQWLRDELWTAQLSAHLQVARAFSVLPHAERPPRSMAGLAATFTATVTCRRWWLIPRSGDRRLASRRQPGQRRPSGSRT